MVENNSKCRIFTTLQGKRLSTIIEMKYFFKKKKYVFCYENDTFWLIFKPCLSFFKWKIEFFESSFQQSWAIHWNSNKWYRFLGIVISCVTPCASQGKKFENAFQIKSAKKSRFFSKNWSFYSCQKLCYLPNNTTWFMSWLPLAAVSTKVKSEGKSALCCCIQLV